MKDNPNHGNRLRPPDMAYERKKQRSRDKYAELQLKSNPLWRHNKILKDLVNLDMLGKEIPIEELSKRGFDINKYKGECLGFPNIAD